MNERTTGKLKRLYYALKRVDGLNVDQGAACKFETQRKERWWWATVFATIKFQFRGHSECGPRQTKGVSQIKNHPMIDKKGTCTRSHLPKLIPTRIVLPRISLECLRVEKGP